MDTSEISNILALYPEYDKMYGPYSHKDGRARVVFYKDKKTSSRQLAKVRLEVKLGRRLTTGETVDHIDEDMSNDDISNLQLLNNKQNAAKTHRKDGKICQKDIDQICDMCGVTYRKVKRTLTCGSKSCKSLLRSKISLGLGLVPPKFKGKGLG